MMTPEDSWTWRCDHLIPSKAGAGQRVLQEILDHLQSLHWHQRDLFGVHLALEEALVNAIKHGNQSDPQKNVRIACRMSPRRVRIQVTDEGPGFDPASIPDPTDQAHLESPCGRGIMLMKSFMSRIEFSEAGNSVVLEKNHPAETELPDENSSPCPSSPDGLS